MYYKGAVQNIVFWAFFLLEENMILKCLVVLAIIALPFLLLLLIIFFNHDKCYKSMEDNGYAKDGCCCGQMGGDFTTDYLSTCCCDCKYLHLTVG